MKGKPAILSLVLLAGMPAARAGGEKEERVREALWLGMNYMIRSASDWDNFEEYASDYLFFFADIARVEDAWMRERARTVGRLLGSLYLEELFTLDSADEVVDAASALWALDCLGMDVDAALATLRVAAQRFPPKDYWAFDPGRNGSPDLDGLIDLLIGFHFTDRIEVPIGATFSEALTFVPSVRYARETDIGGNRYVDQNNLVTHLVYTLSGYASWHLDPDLVPRELAYIREEMPAALMWADPETLSEFVDSLKVMGFGGDDPDVRAGTEVLLAIQKPDGRWESEEVEDEYDRYHATWCAMDALRSYDLVDARGPQDPWVVHLLQLWAEQWKQGREMRPRREIRE